MINPNESLRELFELIRKEQVCIWIGAGLSLYAGYPSAWELKKQILEELLEYKINEEKELADVAEAFVNLKCRTELQDLIVKIFSIKPKDTTYHDILAKVPHINTIITTNYDQLIENALGCDKAVVIRTNKEVPKASEKKVSIYKIHGDITRPKQLILTKSDYSSLYNKDSRSPFWAAITKEIASKHMLFLGYGYEDPNIWAEFSYIDKKLGKLHKNKFLVAPGLDTLKAKALSKKGVSYIDMRGEEFILALEKHLKENVIFDVEGQLIRTDTALGFLRNYGLVGDLTPSRGGYQLKNIRGEKELVNFEFKIDTNDENLKNALRCDWNGEGGIEFTFTKENLTGIEVKIKDFLVIRYADLEKLRFTQVPFWKGDVQVEFPEHDKSIEGLQVECFNLKNSIRITASKNGLQIEIDCSFEEGPKLGYFFKFRLPKKLKQASHALEFFYALDYLTDGVQIVVYSRDLPNGVSYLPPKIKENMQIKEFLEKYTALRTIEKYFKFKFTNIDPEQIDKDLPKIKILASLVSNGLAVADGNDIVLIYEGSYEKIKKDIESIGPDQFILCSYLDEPLNVLGRKIELGKCQVSIKGPRIIETDLEKKMIRIRCIDEKIHLKFESDELAGSVKQ